MKKIRINPLALKDLTDIKEYMVQKLDNPISAVGIVEKIIQSYERLRNFPSMGVSLSSKTDIPTDYKFLISGDYIIFYKIEGDYVSIYRIFNAKRDYLNIFLKDD
ncbi:MAG: type II toxin-antitoxin system RelE/ParE family toxin [Firmicutes bacterium]|nr:type II toxin-antitoxin system RelE/ParE family toxin [Bacillota bacterium]